MSPTAPEEFSFCINALGEQLKKHTTTCAQLREKLCDAQREADKQRATIVRLRAILWQEREERLLEQCGWKLIEVAPKDGISILTWYGTWPAGGYEIVRWGAPKGYEEHWMRASGKPVLGDGPTHWMPLPEPPHE